MKIFEYLKTQYFVPIVFVMIHSVLVFFNIWSNSLVIDEPYHIASGLSHYAERNFSADQVNPPLARMIAVLPLLPARPSYDRTKISSEAGARSEWSIGASWVDQNGEAVVWQTRMARLSGIGWSALGAWLLYRLATRHRGRVAGTMVLALWCFDPTTISLAAVATADLPAAVAAIGAASAYDALLDAERRKFDWLKRFRAGVWLGIALLVKFTLLILPLYWIVWGVGRWLNPSNDGDYGRVPLHRIVQSWLVVIFVALTLVNVGYLFQGSFLRLEEYRFVSKTFAGSLPQEGGTTPPGTSGNRFSGTALGKFLVPLPKDFLLGVDVQRRDFEHPLPSYLNGKWSKGGWWWFYIYAIIIKEPIPWLCLLVWMFVHIILFVGRENIDINALWIEGLGLTLFAFVSAQTGFSHHMRYVLPAYPFLFFFLSRIVGENNTDLASRPSQIEDGERVHLIGRWRTRFRWVLITWLAEVAIVSSPNCLSYFNQFCGGSRHGHRYLLYSNLDWGQGLLQLKRWTKGRPSAAPFHLSYMGAMKPETLGIHYPPVPPFFPERRKPFANRPQMVGPTPGYHAVSATLLHFPYDDSYNYLLKYEPVASIGGSILIYYFGPNEAESKTPNHKSGD